MGNKRTKAGRKARRRAYHADLAREAWGAHQGRRLAAWLHVATTEGLITYRGITMLGGGL